LAGDAGPAVGVAAGAAGAADGVVDADSDAVVVSAGFAASVVVAESDDFAFFFSEAERESVK
jgi:hypothetical protein